MLDANSLLGATTTLVQTFYHVPVTWFLVFLVFILCGFESYRSGGARTIAAMFALLIAVYLSDSANASFGISEIIAAFHIDAYPAIVTGALFIAFFFIIARMIEPTIGAGGPLSGLIGGVGAVILVLALWVSSPALSGLLGSDPLLESIFTENVRLYWIITGFIALSFARG